MALGRAKKVAIASVCIAVLGACLLGVSFVYSSLVTDAMERHNQTKLRGLHYALIDYAKEHADQYPDGFGYLIWTGAISPGMLVSRFDRSDAMESFDWGYGASEPRADLDSFAEEHSSFIVLVWGQPLSEAPERLVAYERLKAKPARTPLLFADGSTRLVSNDESEYLIRAAGHEPVWAD